MGQPTSSSRHQSRPHARTVGEPQRIQSNQHNHTRHVWKVHTSQTNAERGAQHWGGRSPPSSPSSLTNTQPGRDLQWRSTRQLCPARGMQQCLGTHLGPEKGTCAPCIWVEPRDIAERPVIRRPQRHYPIPHGSTARGKPRPEKLPEVMPLGRGRSHQAGAWIRLAHGPAWPHSAPLVSKIWAASWNLLTTPVRRPSRRVKGTARTFQDGGQISPQESEEG